MASGRVIRDGVWLALAVLTGCSASSPALQTRVEELELRVGALGALLERGKAEGDGALTLARAHGERNAELSGRLGALETQVADMSTPPSQPGGPRGQVRAISNTRWDWVLDRDREWVQVGDLSLELDIPEPSFLVMTANCHANCHPGSDRGPGEPDHDKWVTISFFVDGRNAPRRVGLPVFHEPELSWGQVHTHPHRNWQALPTTQLAAVDAGKVVVSLRAMQNHGAGRWQLNGAAMYVVAIPR